jgi:hypothetical protein
MLALFPVFFDPAEIRRVLVSVRGIAAQVALR